MKRLRLWLVVISAFLAGVQVGLHYGGHPLTGWPVGLLVAYAWFAVAFAWWTRKAA